MMSKYFKNFILCGDIDYYCLLCQELFQDIADVEKHIRWEKHRKSIKNQAYLPKYRKDSIYKVANIFYCEICNVVPSDIAAVTEHINNERHKALKMNPKIEKKNFMGQYNNSGYIVINKVILNMAQWNSIVDKNCLLCDIRVRDIDEHMTLEEHIIKMIQSETNYEDERYYRKINEDKYHCFTCNNVFSATNLNDHWLRCQNIDEIKISKLKKEQSSNSTKTVSEEVTKMADLGNELIGTLRKFFYIEEKNDFVTCKYCSNVVPINFKSMTEHMKSQHDKEMPNVEQETKGSDDDSDDKIKYWEHYKEIIDHGKRRSELAKYGKENSIKLNFNGSKGWCLICDAYFSAHMKVFTEHVNGAMHRGYLKLQASKNLKKKGLKEFKTKSILRCSLKYAPTEKEFWIDNNYSVDVHTFFLLRKIKYDPHFKKTKCFACNELFPQGQEREHCETPKHKNNFMAAKFIEIIKTDDWPPEFIREIRANLFHCGFCNRTFPFSNLMKAHLTCSAHLTLQEEKTDFLLNTIKIMTKADDVYMKLLHYGFGSI